MLEMKNTKDLSKTYIKRAMWRLLILISFIMASWLDKRGLKAVKTATHGRIDRHHGTHSYKTHYYTPHTY
jgi:hypothetical protein